MTAPPAGWYPDQADGRLLRYWNGASWTTHTQPNQPQPHAAPSQQADQQGGGPLYTETDLVVNQKQKWFDRAASYAVLDRHGRLVGGVEQVNVRFGTAVGGFEAKNWLSRRFPITDHQGTQVAEIVKRHAFDRSSLKEILTTDDSYALHRPQPLAEPLGSLVVAAALCLDAAIFEDQKKR
jgi:hypothetical protein